MSGYICTKACTLGGVAYANGDAIPAGAVLPNRIRTLTKQGYIARNADAAAMEDENTKLVARVAELERSLMEAEAAAVPSEGIVLPIMADEGVLEVTVAPTDIVQAVTIWQLNAPEAIKAVEALEVENGDALILMDALESRKTVRAAITELAKARLEAMPDADEDVHV